jgi:predicted AAA+ superfamily ATPase
MFHRYLYPLIVSRMREDQFRIQVLVGPRQVGKTTLVQQALAGFPNSAWHTADAQSGAGSAWLEGVWNAARLLATDADYILAIDEIQKISNWSETVKRLWDEDRADNRKLKVWLLGSSRILIQQGLSESLAGRFEMIYAPHWRFTEMEQAFGFTPEQYAWFGAYPGAAGLIGDETRWKGYVRDSLIESALNRDILMLTRIDKPQLLRKLFESGTSYSGQILSYTKMLGQLQDAGNTVTLAHYLHLLDSAGLLCGLQKFASEEVRKRSSSPKFQTYNQALVQAMRPETFEQAQHDAALWGRVVESAVGAHLLSYAGEGLELSYWRNGDDEVDFVLGWKGKVVGLEVKSAGGVSRGLERFRQAFAPHRIYNTGTGGPDWKTLLRMHPTELF